MEAPSWGLHCFMINDGMDAMVKAELDEVGLLAAIDALKHVSPEQQEAAILELEEEHPGVGERVRALLALEKQTAEHIARLEKARVEPKATEPVKLGVVRKIRWRQVDGVWFYSVGDGWSEELMVKLAAQHRLPAIYPWGHFVTAGGLMCYAVDLPDLWRRSASYVDRMLKGGKPTDLPVQVPTKFDLVVN